MRLFATEFGVLVLIANVIAWPVAYFAMQRWLSGFAYRIELGPFVFVASALLALAGRDADGGAGRDARGAREARHHAAL